VATVATATIVDLVGTAGLVGMLEAAAATSVAPSETLKN
jgi:hypothetical protein